MIAEQPTDAKDKGQSKRNEDNRNGAIKIDTDGLIQRTIKLPVSTGNYGNFYCTDEKLWYNDGADIKVFDFNTQQEETLMEGAGFAISNNGKKALLIKNTSISICDFPHFQFRSCETCES